MKLSKLFLALTLVISVSGSAYCSSGENSNSQSEMEADQPEISSDEIVKSCGQQVKEFSKETASAARDQLYIEANNYWKAIKIWTVRGTAAGLFAIPFGVKAHGAKDIIVMPLVGGILGAMAGFIIQTADTGWRGTKSLYGKTTYVLDNTFPAIHSGGVKVYESILGNSDEDQTDEEQTDEEQTDEEQTDDNQAEE